MAEEEEKRADKNKCIKPPERAHGQKLPMTYVGETSENRLIKAQQ